MNKKTSVEAVQFDGNNIKELEDFGATVVMVNSEEVGHITVTDNHSQPVQLKQGDWLIKNKEGYLAVVFEDEFKKTYKVKK